MIGRASLFRWKQKRPCRAFTMIELLIVITIIGVLAAIAIPNFLQAQIRVKIARAKTEMATLELALEQYYLDQKHYPPNRTTGYGTDVDLLALTTPYTYVTRLPLDPFGARRGGQLIGQKGYSYYLALQSATSGLDLSRYGIPGRGYYVLNSNGPDLNDDAGWGAAFPPTLRLYDPTNGSISVGDIIHFGPQ